MLNPKEPKSLSDELKTSDNKDSDKDSNSENINHENCSNELSCDQFRITEDWTSGNNDIDKFIKDTINDARKSNGQFYNHSILEWVPFDRFEDIKQIGEGGFAKVYSATWFVDDEKVKSQSTKVALKRLNESQNISVEYLNELKIHWNLTKNDAFSLQFFGLTKDPETEEFMMIMQHAEKGNLRSFLSSNFNKTLWKDKIKYLSWIINELSTLHRLGYFHKDFHSGNILRVDEHQTSISDFGLSGPSNKQNSDNKICGVLPYQSVEMSFLLPIIN
ncbi:unnamed protein product [Rhizophagus irregularis]|nr:unnamed protein product [Rhizophagus irregularis]